MKKKYFEIGISVVIIALVVALYIFFPKEFLSEIDSQQVEYIQIFDGNSGQSYEIRDVEQVKLIVKDFKSKKARKDGISVWKMGYKYKISFMDKQNVILEEFILNQDGRIRKDPFFYKATEGSFCYEYLNKCISKL